MTALLIISWAVCGGLWRRMLGGWLGLPRSICYLLSVPLVAPVAWAAFPLGTAWQIGLTLAAAIAFLVFFVVSFFPGGRYDVPREVLLKYGPFGIGYVLAQKYWPDNWRLGGFIDGWSSVGEIFLGASFYGCVGLLWAVV